MSYLRKKHYLGKEAQSSEEYGLGKWYGPWVEAKQEESVANEQPIGRKMIPTRKSDENVVMFGPLGARFLPDTVVENIERREWMKWFYKNKKVKEPTSTGMVRSFKLCVCVCLQHTFSRQNCNNIPLPTNMWRRDICGLIWEMAVKLTMMYGSFSWSP